MSITNKTILRKVLRSVVKATGIVSILLLTGCQKLGLLDPKGYVAIQQKQLMIDSLALMLIVVIPVIIMSFAFAFRYRSTKHKGNYSPEHSHNTLLEVFWWGIPTVIVVVLGIMVWKQSHRLDPYRKLDMPGKPMIVQVVALRWKWLFIYPEQGIATVNYFKAPENKQVEFWITADAPMSAFEIPQLVGQIYAMAGMRTRLHMYSSFPGKYVGLDTQFNGDGFSDMKFNAYIVPKAEFTKWVASVKQNKHTLNIAEYQKIVKPSIADPAKFYGSFRPGMFNRIMEQFTKPNMRLH